MTLTWSHKPIIEKSIFFFHNAIQSHLCIIFQLCVVENFYIRTAVCSYLLILVNNYHSLGAQLLNLSYSSLFLSLFAAMGGLFSISMPCDQVVNQVSQCLCTHGSYIPFAYSNTLQQREIMTSKVLCCFWMIYGRK